MDKLLESRWFLRFTALFLAILLFVTVQEEKLKKTAGGEDLDVLRDVPVEVIYDNENLVVTGVPQTVDATIEGPVNIVQTTTLLKDFSFIVDLSSLPMGEHKVRIQHENISEKLQVRIDPATIDVVIEEKITKTFKVEPEFNRQLLAEDFHIVSMEVNPSTIEVTGAKSVVESISFVKATVSSDPGVDKSFEQEARIRVLDRDLNKLDLSVEPENVKVKVDIQENNKEVPIVLNAKGTPPDGVTINSLAATEEKIILSGPNRILDEIEAFHVDVDVSKITKSGAVEIELKKPKDVSKMSINQLKVNIDADVEKASEKDEDKNKEEDEKEEEIADNLETEDTPVKEPVAVDTLKIEDVQVAVTGLDRQFKSTIMKPDDGSVTLTVTAEPDVIGRLEESDFEVTIDASGTTVVGEQVYPVIVNGPNDARWTLSENEVTLKIELA